MTNRCDEEEAMRDRAALLRRMGWRSYLMDALVVATLACGLGCFGVAFRIGLSDSDSPIWPWLLSGIACFAGTFLAYCAVELSRTGKDDESEGGGG